MAGPSGRPLLGRAEIKAQDASDVGLGIEPDSKPPRHANLVGWPNEKHERMSMAQELAARASLVVRG